MVIGEADRKRRRRLLPRGDPATVRDGDIGEVTRRVAVAVRGAGRGVEDGLAVVDGQGLDPVRERGCGVWVRGMWKGGGTGHT